MVARHAKERREYFPDDRKLALGEIVDKGYYQAMAKRANQDIKNKKSRSRKTGKRLKAKHAMLAAKGVRRGSVRFKHSGY